MKNYMILFIITFNVPGRDLAQNKWSVQKKKNEIVELKQVKEFLSTCLCIIFT